jgi:hypothetical protein
MMRGRARLRPPAARSTCVRHRAKMPPRLPVVPGVVGVNLRSAIASERKYREHGAVFRDGAAPPSH